MMRELWSGLAGVIHYQAHDPSQPPLADDELFWRDDFPRARELWDSFSDGLKLKRRAMKTLLDAAMTGRDGGLESIFDNGWKRADIVKAAAIILTPYRCRPVLPEDALEMALIDSELLISGRWTENLSVDTSSWTWGVSQDFWAY